MWKDRIKEENVPYLGKNYNIINNGISVPYITIFFVDVADFQEKIKTLTLGHSPKKLTIYMNKLLKIKLMEYFGTPELANYEVVEYRSCFGPIFYVDENTELHSFEYGILIYENLHILILNKNGDIERKMFLLDNNIVKDSILDKNK